MAKPFISCDPATNIDPSSGFCESNSTFYSKRKPIPLPASHNDFDITTFIFSRPHRNDAAYIDAITGRELSFTQVWRAVESVATCLSNMGIRKGQVVLLLSPNSIFFPIVSLSVMALGAIITTANPLNTSQEIAKQILDSNAALLFTIPQLLHKLLPESNNDIPIVLITDGNTSSDYSKCVNILSTLSRTPDHANTSADMMKTEPSRDGRMKERVTQEDPAALLYSSGTTGVSKGVVCSHRNLVAMIGMVEGRLRMHEPNQIYIATVPMFHTFGFATFVLTLLANGCRVVVLPKFGVDEMLLAVEKFKVTYLPVVPPILAAMANDADRINSKYDLKSLRYTLCGGAPLNKAVTEAFMENYPQVNILQGYAMTESNGAGASTDAMEECRGNGTAGLLTPSTEAKIVDPKTGEALPVDGTGELWLRGPSIMKGYFNNKEATECTVTSDGWLKTGDLCYIDHDGFLFVVDRLKELIKYKGYQVAPAELEALLLTHPEIAHAAVIPFPGEKVGQYPMAFVVPKRGSSISDKAVMDFVAKQVAPYKKIRRVAFVASIPKTASGKILRKDLIKIATAKL